MCRCWSNDEPKRARIGCDVSCTCNGLALGLAQDGKTVTIRARRCSILCLQEAKVQVHVVAVKTGFLATRSTLRAYMYDELAFVTLGLSRMLRV